MTCQQLPLIRWYRNGEAPGGGGRNPQSAGDFLKKNAGDQTRGTFLPSTIIFLSG